jgi:hypothetical protein
LGIALAAALGFDAVAAYRLLLPAFNAAFATSCQKRSINVALGGASSNVLKHPVLVRFFGPLREPGIFGASERSTEDIDGPDWVSSVMMVEESTSRAIEWI